MDRFSFFFAFYGLILGLGVTEVLKGFAGYVRLRPLRSIDPQTALLAAFIFLDICATWLDAWSSLKNVSLDFAGLWAPILLSTAFYMAASVVFPRDDADFARLADYYAERKTFVAITLLGAEFIENFTFRDIFIRAFHSRPAVFWLYLVPYNVAIKVALVSLILVRGRRANIASLLVLVGLFLIPYWDLGAFAAWVHAHFDR
jgi:hypothetical protein